MKTKKVSVIMGVYNSGDRFMNAVKSIEQQTYINWEFIICDDGSTDDTYLKLMDYLAKKPNYKIIRNDNNLGLAATLNHCIEYCEGEYIARMDDDDISYPERFEKQVMFLEAHPEIGFISSNIDIFDGVNILGDRKMKVFPTKKDMVKRSQFVHPATMFRAEVLRSVDGYRVSKETMRGQDYDLFMRLYGAGYQGANIESVLLRYTEETKKKKKKNMKSRVYEMKIRIHGYKAMGVLHWAFPFIFRPYVSWLKSLFNSIDKGNKK